MALGYFRGEPMRLRPTLTTFVVVYMYVLLFILSHTSVRELQLLLNGVILTL